MMRCGWVRDRIQPWLRDYDSLQSFAVILLYAQIGCGLIGSLGASYNGVLVMNLGIALFALVAIESSSQSLGRTYAVLLLCSILIDVFWFSLFAHHICLTTEKGYSPTWATAILSFGHCIVISGFSGSRIYNEEAIRNISSEKYESFFIFSVKLTLAMQIVGFSVRLSSSLLWIQIYRLGASCVHTTGSRQGDLDLRSSFLSPPSSAVARQTSGSDEVLGGAIYDPSYYSSLFENGRENRFSIRGQNHAIGGTGSTSTADVSPRKLSIGQSFLSVDNDAIGGSGSASIADVSQLKLAMGRCYQSADEDHTSGQPQPF